MHTFYVGDRAIHYRRTGSGPPVVLTPGGRLGSSALASLARALEDHTPYIEAAVRGGMAEVAQTPHFGELIRANPGNAARLLEMDPSTFIAVMKSWNDVFYPTTATPVIAATLSELRTVTAPALVFNGNDDFHPDFAAHALHEAIPGSRLLPCAWTRDDWMLRYVGRIPESVVELYPRMSEAIIDYIREIEQT
jgi:pimeloyl-ACP methyl ester carboxylesterase